MFLACFPPILTLDPNTSNLSLPIQIRRDEDFYIASLIELECDQFLEIKIQWTIKNSITSDPVNDSLLVTTFNDLSLPAHFFSPGLYELKLTVTIIASLSFTSKSVYVRIVPLGLLVNLLPLETSMITMGARQDLPLNPGLYSVGRDGESFNASVTISLACSGP